MQRFILNILISFIVLGCSTRKEILYFQGAEMLEGKQYHLDYEPIIQPNDVLSIQVTSLNEEVVKPFKKDFGSQSGNASPQNLTLAGYLVSPEGEIEFPVLGTLNVAGKKRTAVEDLIQGKVKKYVKDAVVNVRIVNFTVTVLGETGSSRVQVPDGRISIPQLFASSGDINYTGKRNNILVIREVNGVKTVGRIDMTSANLFSNPYYYLKQNDIVYVEPTYKKVKSAGFITSYAGIFSLIGSITGLIFLFTK